MSQAFNLTDTKTHPRRWIAADGARGCYFPSTDLNVGDGGGRGTGMTSQALTVEMLCGSNSVVIRFRDQTSYWQITKDVPGFFNPGRKDLKWFSSLQMSVEEARAFRDQLTRVIILAELFNGSTDTDSDTTEKT